MGKKEIQPRRHEEHEVMHEEVMDPERIASIVVDSGLRVHRVLGPGLLESAYEHCLAHELQVRGLLVERQVVMPISYDGAKLDAGYRIDLMVGRNVIVEVKSTFQNLAWRVRWRSFLSTGAERPFGGREHRSAKDGRQMAARAGFERRSKAAEALIPLHQAQLLTYLKLSGCRIGFLMNFHAILFKQGLRRVVL